MQLTHRERMRDRVVDNVKGSFKIIALGLVSAAPITVAGPIFIDLPYSGRSIHMADGLLTVTVIVPGPEQFPDLLAVVSLVPVWWLLGDLIPAHYH